MNENIQSITKMMTLTLVIGSAHRKLKSSYEQACDIVMPQGPSGHWSRLGHREFDSLHLK